VYPIRPGKAIVLAAIEDRLDVSRSVPVPACLPPWRENPYRLVSLWKMLPVDAGSFVSCASSIIKYWQGLGHGAKITSAGIRELGSALGELQRECEKHGLDSSVNQMLRIRAYFDTGDVRTTVLSQLLGEVVVRLEEDLHGETFLAVPRVRVPYYEPKSPLFGVEVDDAFPSTAFDIAEAGKCYALYRNTACVFHLMRVLEIGLGTLAKQFNEPYDHANWETIINRVEKILKDYDKLPNRPPTWKDDREFYSQCASHFRVVKDAWRNYTAHARGKFDEQEAYDMLGSVRGFMQKLATRLHE
jgi:hypothetical protein